jgi:hypothetical protein
VGSDYLFGNGTRNRTVDPFSATASLGPGSERICL